MNLEEKKIKSKFGELKMGKGPHDDFHWFCEVEIKDCIFPEKIPISIFTKKPEISKGMIEFVEEVVLNINSYLELAILFVKKVLTNEKEEYKIKENEYIFLDLDFRNFPIDLPELNFTKGADEWMIRFAEGKFDICYPYGIGVNFKNDKPFSVENLEDSEFIE